MRSKRWKLQPDKMEVLLVAAGLVHGHNCACTLSTPESQVVAVARNAYDQLGLRSLPGEEGSCLGHPWPSRCFCP